MNLLEFTTSFPDEEACKLHFKEMREIEGVQCKKCHSTDHYWLKAKWQWQCKKCQFRTTLKSGSSMHNSKLTFKKWYRCMMLMTTTKNGISAKEVQRQLGHNRYQTIWSLMHRVRGIMKRTISQEYYFYESCRRGFAIEAGWTPLHDLQRKWREGYHSKLQFSYIDFSFCEFNYRKGDMAGLFYLKDELIFSRKTRSSSRDESFLEGCFYIKQNNRICSSNTKWNYLILSNFKYCILGVFHHVKFRYLRNYMSEFCFKLNYEKCVLGTFLSLVRNGTLREQW